MGKGEGRHSNWLLHLGSASPCILIPATFFIIDIRAQIIQYCTNTHCGCYTCLRVSLPSLAEHVCESFKDFSSSAALRHARMQGPEIFRKRKANKVDCETGNAPFHDAASKHDRCSSLRRHFYTWNTAPKPAQIFNSAGTLIFKMSTPF